MDAVSSSPLIHGEGTSAWSWQRWLAVRPMPERALQAWLPARSRLVVVAPHPDDEVLACGAMIAMHAERGGATLVVAVTDGEASHPESTTWSRHELAAVRCRERIAGLACLGATDSIVVRIGLADGEVMGSADTLAQRLQELLHPSDLVVSTWAQDGHPDHEASGQAARLACSRAGARLVEAPVWMWHWARLGDVRVPWNRLYGLRVSSDARARKQSALAAHRSQLGTVGSAVPGAEASPVVGHTMVALAARDIEYFFVQ